jgi:hypothetical protein
MTNKTHGLEILANTFRLGLGTKRVKKCTWVRNKTDDQKYKAHTWDSG